MAIYTHDTPYQGEACTFIKMVETDAPMSDLGLSDDWYQVIPEYIEDIRELTGMSLPEHDGWMHVATETTTSGHTVRKYGRL